jgi:predicted nucleotidyltransferase
LSDPTDETITLRYDRGGEATMSMTTRTQLAMHVISTLRAQEAELRQAGIRHLSLFGSVARGDAQADSDVDLLADFDPAAGMDLIQLVGLERRIGAALGRSVEILAEPVENPRLRANIERDRLIAF